MCACHGHDEQMHRVQKRLEPLLRDAAAITALITRADAAGHTFDD